MQGELTELFTRGGRCWECPPCRQSSPWRHLLVQGDEARHHDTKAPLTVFAPDDAEAVHQAHYLCTVVYLWLVDKTATDPAPPPPFETNDPNPFLKEFIAAVCRWGSVLRGQLPLPSMKDLNAFSRESMAMRRKWAWSIPTREALDLMAQHSPLVEVGAGGGYWAKQLSEMGCDIEAWDTSGEWNAGWNAVASGGEGLAGTERWFEGMKVGGPEVVRSAGSRTLLLMWPDYLGEGTYGMECVEGYSGEVLLLVGEWRDSTLGSYEGTIPPTGQSFSVTMQHYVETHFTLEKTATLPNFPLYKDRVMVWRRKECPSSPDRVATVPGRGRCYVAGKEYAAWERILAEDPAVHLVFDPTKGSRYYQMWEQWGEAEGTKGLQHAALGDDIADTIRNDVIANHPEFADGAPRGRELSQLVRTVSVAYFNGFGGLVDEHHEMVRVFPTISFCNHSCRPTAAVVPADGILHALTEIKEGEEITISYLDAEDLLLPRDRRRELLAKRWGFQCTCDRCTGPYDDMRVMSNLEEVPIEVTPLDSCSFSDPDGDVIELRVEGSGVVYSVDGDPRPVSHEVSFDPPATIDFVDLDRAVTYPIDALPNILGVLRKAGVSVASPFPSTTHVGRCPCGGRWAGVSGETMVCTDCLKEVPGAADLLEQEGESCKSARFATDHPRHWEARRVADNPQKALDAALTLATAAGLEAAETPLWVELHSKVSEWHTQEDRFDEAQESYSAMLTHKTILERVRHPATEDGVPDPYAITPDAKVLAFLFKD
eukprot:Sspe_Gene.3953::Locus_1320_Transcript_1_1_Confidence_1.000_Length_2410::g.3953::m.3953